MDIDSQVQFACAVFWNTACCYIIMHVYVILSLYFDNNSCEV